MTIAAGTIAEGRRHRGGLLPIVGAVAACVALAIAAYAASQTAQLLGLPATSSDATYGMPIVRAVSDIAAALTMGFIAFAAFLVPPQANGIHDAPGYAAMRSAATCATVWAGAAAALVPITLAYQSGHSVAEIMSLQRIWGSVGDSQLARAWLWTAAIAVVIAIASRLMLRWWSAPVLLAVTLVGVLPVGFAGHSSTGGSHDVATNSMILHLWGTGLWLGGLCAVLIYLRRGGAHVTLAATRYSTLAVGVFVVMAVTGLLNTLVRIPLGTVFTSTYGLLAFAKVIIVLAAGAFGYMHRQHSIPQLKSGKSGPLIRLATVEALIFAVAVGIGVGLGSTPPPSSNLEANPSSARLILGYDLTEPPTLSNLMFDWRFDVIFGSLAIVMAVTYVVGVIRLRKRGDSWPIGRVVAWVLGCLALLFATSSGFGRYSPAVFSIHMLSHMALSMLVPVLLVLGGPVTLALRALTPAGKGQAPGLREWILAALHSPVSRFLTQPLVAMALFIVGFYALYLGGVFDAYADSHAAHLIMTAHFLASGYLFYWVAIGIDPAPRKVSHPAKVAMVFFALPFHAFFGVTLMASEKLIAHGFYKSLALPWHPDLAADQRLGGGIAWAAGEFPLVIVMIALLVQWSRSDRSTAKRIDRAADRDDDADLAAYNRMLAELARRDQA